MAINFSNENLTLTQMRTFVGELADLDIGFDANDDISTDLVNGFVKEGFQKIVALSQRFPYYQATYSFVTTANQLSYSSFTRNIPSGNVQTSITDIQSIIAVVNNTDMGNSLIYIDQAIAEATWVGTSDQANIPAYFSIWGNLLNLWPRPNDAYTITVRAFRKPFLTWFTDQSTAIDIDPQMQLPLVNYVMARIFQFQEDTEMAREYMSSFERAVAVIQGQLTAPSSNRQLIMSGGLTPTASYAWWNNTQGMRVIPGPYGIAL